MKPLEILVDSVKTYYHTYTVIGYWPVSMQRFAGYSETASPEEAEKSILNKYHDISICGVIEGQHLCVDNCNYVRTNSN
jgi:hypothetical protein